MYSAIEIYLLKDLIGILLHINFERSLHQFLINNLKLVLFFIKCFYIHF